LTVKPDKNSVLVTAAFIQPFGFDAVVDDFPMNAAHCQVGNNPVIVFVFFRLFLSSKNQFIFIAILLSNLVPDASSE